MINKIQIEEWMVSDSISDKIKAMEQMDSDFIELIVKNRKDDSADKVVIFVNGNENVEKARAALEPLKKAMGTEVDVGDTRDLPPDEQPKFINRGDES